MTGGALYVLIHLVERDERYEEHGDEPPARAKPVLAVPTTPGAMEDSLAGRSEEDS